ncbi:MAG: Gfo/Idh/MocA family oxidoreductase [Kineosporiaceae bacterium]|nr:Gfo/Idh/MocA family oxidoreductase [Aeromicrobium sp.]
MTDLRAGLIGLGMMGRNHARVLNAMDGVDFVVAADAAGDVHSAAGAARVVGSVDELIAVGVDFCIVAVPTALHEEIGLRLADAGVHALIEKPLADTTVAATRLAEAFESQGLVGGVGHIERYNPALRALRLRLEQGELGDVYQVTTRRQGPFPGRIADVGVVKDLATHDLDLTAWVTQLEYRDVSARAVHKSGRPHEDMIAIVAQLGESVIANHLVNWLSPMKERVTVVTGEKGCFVADTLTADLTFHENSSVATEWDALARFRGVSEGNMTRFAIPKPEPLRVELEAFRDAVSGKSSDIVMMRQGLRTVAVAEACIESASTATTITIEAL